MIMPKKKEQDIVSYLPDFLRDITPSRETKKSAGSQSENKDFRRDRFEIAFKWVLKHEGSSYVVNEDIGEVSKFGITLKSYREIKPDASEKDVEQLTEDQAREFYWRNVWIKRKVYLLGSLNLAAKVFDMIVHIGPVPAIKILQSSINHILKNIKPVSIPDRIQEDGIIGPITAKAANAIMSFDLVTEMSKRQIEYYQSLCAKSPNLKKFLSGWMARANDRPPI